MSIEIPTLFIPPEQTQILKLPTHHALRYAHTWTSQMIEQVASTTEPEQVPYTIVKLLGDDAVNAAVVADTVIGLNQKALLLPDLSHQHQDWIRHGPAGTWLATAQTIQKLGHYLPDVSAAHLVAFLQEYQPFVVDVFDAKLQALPVIKTQTRALIQAIKDTPLYPK